MANGPTLFSRASNADLTRGFSNATGFGQDRIVRKETALGFIRDIDPPQDHIGLQLCPWLEVATDDVIFGYLKGDADGLAPARAEDAESELAQKDQTAPGEGRASLIDWALKDHYDASDISRYRELRRVAEAMANGSFPLTVSSMLEDWQTKFARDAATRRRKLDNRVEWLIMNQALATGAIAYNDGKIKFAVDFGRPVAQANGNAANDVAGAGVVDGLINFSANTHDPIGFYQGVQEFMYDTYGVQIDRVICSKKFTRRIVNSDKFAQRAGLGAAYVGATLPAQPQTPDLSYLLDGWGPSAAVQVVENATGISHIVYDSVYRTRALGSNTIVNNRFWPENLVLFLPSAESVSAVDESLMGFGKTLTSPHPEGNWTPSFYEWERDTVDPWGLDAGTGIKAFPVFPHMEYTYACNVTL